MRSTHTRRRVTLKERKTACEVCGYPVSQRHHFFMVAHYGESDDTAMLCSNCHELYHLMYNALVKRTSHSLNLTKHILFSFRIPFAGVLFLVRNVYVVMTNEIKQGYIEIPATDLKKYIIETLELKDLEDLFNLKNELAAPMEVANE